jgi:hypothetical protein
VWVKELPKNNYGKVLKTELRRRLLDESAAADEELISGSDVHHKSSVEKGLPTK